MQFVLVIYHGDFPLPGSQGAADLSEEDRASVHADYATIGAMPNGRGAPPLGLPETATTVRVTDGSTVTTDGPHLGVRGAVGGFLTVEAEDLDAAVAIAARVPQARLGDAVEVRPSQKYW